MRPRLVFIVVAIVLAAAFAALNWSEFTRTTPLSFGLFVTEASVGIVLLALMGLTLLVFLLSATFHESRLMYESRRHSKALQAQRDLAEKAEASRFTDLRQQLDAHLRDVRQQGTITTTEFEKSLLQSHRDMRLQLEQMHRALSTRLGELEARLDSRLDRPPLSEMPPRDHVKA